MAVGVTSLRGNPLFRVLAFLDNTHSQSFDRNVEVALDGSFVRPDTLFAKGTCMYALLDAGLRALRSNILQLFDAVAERDALLQVVGTDGIEDDLEVLEEKAKPISLQPPPPRLSDKAYHTSDSVLPPEPTDKTSIAPSNNCHSASTLPSQTEWSRAVLRPVSLIHFAEAFESGFPLHLLCRLQDVFCINVADGGSVTQQYLIDAIDRWMSERDLAENKRMVAACGVQPNLLETVKLRAGSLSDALIDFVIDVVFPPPSVGDSTTESGVHLSPHECPKVVDWLMLAYTTNRESVDVDTDVATSPPPAPDQAETTDELGGWEPDDGELVLTMNNLDRIMKESPQLIPKQIRQERRPSWQSPYITASELDIFYTAAELRTIVKQIASLADAPEAKLAMEQELRHTISPVVMRDAVKATKKSAFINVLVRLHKTEVASTEPPMSRRVKTDG